MSVYLSMSPAIERAAVENTSAFPQAPQVLEVDRPGRLRMGTAAVLRHAARLQVAAAVRLERPVHSVATA
jgi:hypothetical protein